MNRIVLAQAFVIALCLTLVNQQRVVAADADTAYTVVVKKVEVKETKKDGSSWDVDNGKPDLAVSVRNESDKDQKAFTTKTKNDTFSADFDEPTTLKIRAGQVLEIEVLDIDVAVNDIIGKVRREIPADVLSKGKWRIESFDQVISLEIEFKKL